MACRYLNDEEGLRLLHEDLVADLRGAARAFRRRNPDFYVGSVDELDDILKSPGGKRSVIEALLIAEYVLQRLA